MVVLLLAISAHEAGHAWMSYKFGDDTAYMLGRVTLNPVTHTDPIGTLSDSDCLVSFSARSAARSARFRLSAGASRRRSIRANGRITKLANVMVSIAGVLANLILLIIAIVVSQKF